MKTKEPLHSHRLRAVTIEIKGGTYFVLYVNRKKGQHYSAGQFDARSHTRQQVEQWARDQQHLVLIP